jgi:hypothetical protein
MERFVLTVILFLALFLALLCKVREDAWRREARMWEQSFWNLQDSLCPGGPV